MAHEPRRQEEPEPFAAGSESSPGERRSLRKLTTADLLGRTLGERYRFEDLLGEGTFARVFRVFDLYRRVDLAAKVLRSDIAHEPAFLERFRREAAVLARLQHPHIVRYYDTVEEEGVVFILTDYIPGQTLQELLGERERPMTPRESLAILAPLAAGLHYAHREGIVHRDLKPANILMDENGHVYITDFGIARILSDTSTLTVDTTVGTPHYMSPEQILAQKVTAATDIYALGVMLYQMYTGRLPFTGESQGSEGTTTAVRIVYEHLHVRPTPPRQINPDLPPAVEEVILRCLEKDPAARFGSVSEVYEALQAAVEGTETEPAETPSAEREPSRMEAAAPAPRRRERAEAQTVPDQVLVPRLEVEKPKRKRKPDLPVIEPEDEDEEEEGQDPISRMVWGGVILWAGVVLFLDNLTSTADLVGDAGAWIMAGAGALVLVEVAVRLAMPEYRTRIGFRLIVGTLLLMFGLGIRLDIGTLWPLALIAIGVGILVNHFLSNEEEQ